MRQGPCEGVEQTDFVNTPALGLVFLGANKHNRANGVPFYGANKAIRAKCVTLMARIGLIAPTSR